MSVTKLLATSLAELPPGPRDILSHLPLSGGVLESEVVTELADFWGDELPDLMIRLLPVAAAFASPTISGFRVGAVASGEPFGARWGRLCLGGNMEFAGETLGLTIHAEQAATLSAWFAGERGIVALAASASPCGHCRQFLNEIGSSSDLQIITPSVGATPRRHTLEALLPDSFRPGDLGVAAGPFDQSRVEMTVGNHRGSALVEAARQAAGSSYAPYTGSYAGCSLQTTEGVTYAASYIENAAYNPSCLALPCALLRFHLHGGEDTAGRIEQVALVEVQGPTSQRAVTERLLKVTAPAASFSYHPATAVD